MTIDTYAFIKDNNVINIVVFDSPSEELLNIFKSEKNLDQIILSTEKTAIGGTYDGSKFWLPQPYPSWIKNEELNEWEAPVPMPEDILHKYIWNESEISWNLAPAPSKPFESWIFDSDLYIWEAPVPYPQIEEGSDENYIWDENTTSWLLLPPSN